MPDSGWWQDCIRENHETLGILGRDVFISIDMSWYSPVTELSEFQRERGLRYLYQDGMCSHAMTLLVTGAFLPGMALALGASNIVIGLLASLGPVTQMLQIPAILLVERVGLRKLLTVGFAFFSRSSLLLIVILPFLELGDAKVPLFFTIMLVFFGCAAVAGCAWNSWIKDVIPDKILGSYLARRMSAATALGAVLTIAAGFGIDGLTALMGSPSRAFGLIFGVAGAMGLVGAGLLTRVPEPRMLKRNPETNWMASLFEPLRDQNFRRLLGFTSLWNFSITMAGAFFTVYMLERIGLQMGTVILLAVLSQATNVYFFKVWGMIADRFSNKSVLSVAAPLFLVVILLYPFTTMPGRHSLTLPLLVLIHFLGGVSTAGFTLCAGSIALRLAPRGKATAYLGANAFCGGIAATLSPIVGGAIGSYFAAREIGVRIFYRGDTSMPDEFSMPAMHFQGLDFVFITAAIFGFYALHRLSLVEEEGTVSEGAVREQVMASMRQTFVSASNIAGVRRMTFFPYELLRASARNRLRRNHKALRTPRNGEPPARLPHDSPPRSEP